MAVVALVLAIPAFGYYQEEVAKYQIVVGKVNDKSITSNEYLKLYSVRLSQKRSLLQYWLSQVSNKPADEQSKALTEFASKQANQLSQELSKLDDSVLEEMIEDEILRTQAASYGLSVNPDEIQQAIMKDFQAEPKDGESPEDAAKRQADFQTNYNRALSDMSLSEDELRKMIQAGLVREKMKAQLEGQVVSSGEQVHLFGILTTKEEEANIVLERLKDQNVDFKVAASQMSIDNISSDKGGELGWIPYGVLEPALETVAFSLTPGELSDPVATEMGYWVIKVSEKANKEIEPEMLEVVKANSLDRWFFEQQKVNKIERNLTPELKLWAYERSVKDEAKKAKQKAR